MAEVIRKVLKTDAKKAFDNLAATQFNSCALRAVATDTASLSITTNGTATVTNSVALGNDLVKLIVDTMKERNIPAYTGDDYYSIAWPSTYRPLKNDLEGI